LTLGVRAAGRILGLSSVKVASTAVAEPTPAVAFKVVDGVVSVRLSYTVVTASGVAGASSTLPTLSVATL
jgi:hypothetical protein